jgi:cellulose synthase/poly-beta-1,6-N-acetylglucosamine synthase-like glycosyltransferase
MAAVRLRPPRYGTAVVALEIVFWVCAGLILWTHVGYPLVAAALARIRPRRVRAKDWTPRVTVIVAAHDEEAVIERRLRNLLELDYPAEALDVIVASDASTDRTHELVEAFAAREPRVRLLRCPRGGKVAAQNLAVRETDAEIVAFSDANSTWAPDALRLLVRALADPDVAYVCGQLRLLRPDGSNREGLYWRYEMWVRRQESSLGSITGGNGSIYAVRRVDWIDVDPRFGHDMSFPYSFAQRGKRAVYDEAALAFEKPARDTEDEYRRKVRMFEHAWLMLFRGGMLRRVAPLFAFELLSHRHLRYGSGWLHLVLLAANVALVALGAGLVYQLALGVQVALLVLALAGRVRLRLPGAGIALYYVLVSAATVVSCVRYLRFGVPAVWEKAVGTR